MKDILNYTWRKSEKTIKDEIFLKIKELDSIANNIEKEHDKFERQDM